MESFEFKGEWSLPGSETRAYGVLKFHPVDGAELELYGSLTSDDFLPELEGQDLILGLVNNSKMVTLHKCFMTKSGDITLVQGRESNKATIKYSVVFILVGLWANSIEELEFNNVSARISNLDEWVGITGFSRKNDYADALDKKVNVEYKLPESIPFEINDNLQGKFSFSVNTLNLSRYQKSVSIAQKVYLDLTYKNDVSINTLLRDVLTFQNFLTLAIYRSSYPISLTLHGDKHKDNIEDYSFRKDIELYFSSNKLESNKKPKLDLQMIFSYKPIADNFPNIIKKWYSEYELLAPALDLVFEQFYNQGFFTVNTFLNLAQAAETYHSRIHNHTKMPRDEYKKMKETVLSVVPVEYHTWLEAQFHFGNNLNLHARLEELAEKYSNPVIDKIIGDKKQFVLDVKNSRNYYTHYTSSGVKKALKGSELFYLSEKLKALLVCAFLIETGFDRDKLSDLLDNVKWILFNHLANWRNE